MYGSHAVRLIIAILSGHRDVRAAKAGSTHDSRAQRQAFSSRASGSEAEDKISTRHVKKLGTS